MPDEYFQSSLTAQEIETVLTQNQSSVLYSAQSLTDAQKNIARNNIGAYSKPSTGIPKTDLSSAVQNSLDKADAATIPSGGSTGQVLKKNSSSDYDVTWDNESPGGTSDYSDLTNKPSINGITLAGNKTASDLGLYSKPSTGIPKTDLASGVQTSLDSADSAYQKPDNGIPNADLDSDVRLTLSTVSLKYQKPSSGIPKTDLASDVQVSLGKADTAYQVPSVYGIPKGDLQPSVQTSLGKADTAYQKPSYNIPESDLAVSVQTSLGKADTAYQKPSTGIPETDLASAVQATLIPSGGSAGQVLKKNSSSDYDVIWDDESGGSGGGGGTSNYSDLTNKPSINGVTLTGNKKQGDLGIYPAFTLTLLCNNSSAYQESPSGIFSIEDPSHSGKVIGQIMTAVDRAYSYNTNYIMKLIYGTVETQYELYDLVRAEMNQENYNVTLIFRTISFRNNEIVLKTVTINAPSYYNPSEASVTYSEIVLGSSSSANGANS